MPDVGFVLLRFIHYTATLTLFGASLFPLYATRDRDRLQAARGWRGIDAALAITAPIAAVSAIALFGQVAANMVGSWSDLDLDALASIATTTTFGNVWIVHTLIAFVVAALALAAGSGPSRTRPWMTTVLSGAMLASMAGIGHAQDGSGALRVGHVVADALHLLAAGAWLGGIAALLIFVQASAGPFQPQDEEDPAIIAAVRFAGLGYVAVATLMLSGVIDAWILVGSFRGLVLTRYGQLLIVKLALFGAMLLLAAMNRFKIVPALVTAGARDRKKSVLFRLRRHILVEQVMGLLVILAVSALGTMEPAANLIAG